MTPTDYVIITIEGQPRQLRVPIWHYFETNRPGAAYQRADELRAGDIIVGCILGGGRALENARVLYVAPWQPKTAAQLRREAGENTPDPEPDHTI